MKQTAESYANSDPLRCYEITLWQAFSTWGVASGTAAGGMIYAFTSNWLIITIVVLVVAVVGAFQGKQGSRVYIDSYGIHGRTVAAGEFHMPWNAISKVRKTRLHVVSLSSDERTICIPKNALVDAGFLGFMRRNTNLENPLWDVTSDGSS